MRGSREQWHNGQKRLFFLGQKKIRITTTLTRYAGSGNVFQSGGGGG